MRVSFQQQRKTYRNNKSRISQLMFGVKPINQLKDWKKTFVHTRGRNLGQFCD